MDLGTEHNTLDVVSADMRAILETVDSSKDLRHMLISPVIRPDIKRKVLHQVFGTSLHKEVLTFIDLIVRKGRADVLASTAKEFQKLLDRKNGVVIAQVRSAIELDQDTRKTIGTKLREITGRNVTAMFSVDPSIKGGFVARIEDTLIDASLAHQLETLRQRFRAGDSIMN